MEQFRNNRGDGADFPSVSDRGSDLPFGGRSRIMRPIHAGSPLMNRFVFFRVLVAGLTVSLCAGCGGAGGGHFFGDGSPFGGSDAGGASDLATAADGGKGDGGDGGTSAA